MTSLWGGVTSERLVEYQFVARNLMSPKKQTLTVDIGSVSYSSAKTISEFGKGKWQICRIDVAESDCDLRKDAGCRMIGVHSLRQMCAF
jgi:hypothetical protein